MLQNWKLKRPGLSVDSQMRLSELCSQTLPWPVGAFKDGLPVGINEAEQSNKVPGTGQNATHYRLI